MTGSRQMQTLHRDVFIPEIVSQTEKVAGEGVASLWGLLSKLFPCYLLE